MDFLETIRSSPVARAAELAKLLLQEDVCPGCILRFLNCRPAVFASPLPSSKDAKGSLRRGELLRAGISDQESGVFGDGDGEGEETLCPACLGLLQGLTAVRGKFGKGGCLHGGGPSNGVARPTDDQDGGSCKQLGATNGGCKCDPCGEATLRSCVAVFNEIENGEPAAVDPGTGLSIPKLEGKLGFRINLCAAVQARVLASGHQITDFALEVAMPPISQIRQYALWAHLQHCMPEIPHLKRACSEAVLPVKDALKYALPERLKETLGAPCTASSDLRLTLTFSHPSNSAALEAALGPSKPSSAKRQKGKYGWKKGGASAGAPDPPEREESLASVQKALDSLSSQEIRERLPWPLQQADLPCTVNVHWWRSPVYVGGRYLKLVRGISQSPWLVDEERIGKEASVQELVAAGIVQHFKADDYKFSSAGREDIDVRMLGCGRPFVLEILNARVLPSPTAYAQMQESINASKEGWVAVRSLQLVDRAQVELLREGEAEKQKEYAAIVWLPRLVTEADVEKLRSTKDLVIQQRTPIRVLHRRSPLVRPRTIHSMRAEQLPDKPHYLLLYLCTQAGTYVKEFVHGDLGRTHPNVGSLLGCEADIVHLDVTNIKMEFP